MATRIRTFFAIRQKGTNLFLPEVKTGYSWSEPEPMSTSALGPRLFPTRKNAKTALTHWLKGSQALQLKSKDAEQVDPFSAAGAKYDQGVTVQPVEAESQPQRYAEDYEVVELQLRIIEEINGQDEKEAHPQGQDQIGGFGIDVGGGDQSALAVLSSQDVFTKQFLQQNGAALLGYFKSATKDPAKPE